MMVEDGCGTREVGVLGEEALLEGARYVGTARALEDSLAALVAGEDLLRLLRTRDEMGVSLLLHLTREAEFNGLARCGGAG